MATQKQIETNRANAQKSTGVKTEAGKKRSSMNAMKHGLLNTDFSNHDTLKIEEVKDNFFSDYKPKTALEILILERIAVHTIKLKRIAKAEAGYIDNSFKSFLIDMEFEGK